MVTKTIARDTFECLSFQDLATSLVLKLIILAKEAIAEGALENAASMLPHIPLTFNTRGILKWTSAGMCGQALPAMADPCFTEVTDGTNHAESSCELA